MVTVANLMLTNPSFPIHSRKSIVCRVTNHSMNAKTDVDESATKAKRARSRPTTQCRFGAECRNIGKCRFTHPSDGDASSATKKSNPNKSSSEKAKKDKSKIRCRYGMTCQNTKCPYFHHPAAVNEVLSPTSPKAGSDSPSMPAVTPTTPLVVSVLPEFVEEEVTLTGTPKKSTTKVKKCRWGSGCRNKKCAFAHPNRIQNDDGSMMSAKQLKHQARGSTAKDGSVSVASKATLTLNRYSESLGGAPTTPSNNSGMDMAKATINGAPTYAQRLAVRPILPPSPDIHSSRDKNKVVPVPEEDYSPSGPGMPGAPHQPPLYNGAKHNAHSINMPLSVPNVSAFNGVKTSIYSYLPDGQLFNGSLQHHRQHQHHHPINNGPMPPNVAEHQPRPRTPLYGMNPSDSMPTQNSSSTESFAQQLGYLPSNEGPLKPRPPPGMAPQRATAPPDADWLMDLLGLNDMDATNAELQSNNLVGGGMAQMNDIGITDFGTLEEVVTTTNHHSVTPASAAFSRNESHGVGIDAQPIQENTIKPDFGLISEDEIGQSRIAALELRFESQQKAGVGSSESLFTLLQSCRSKQEMVRDALERAMDASQGIDSSAGLDETNVVSLLELNELLLSSIDMAESSLGMNGAAGKNQSVAPSAKATKPNDLPSKNESSWKPIEKKAAPQSSLANPPSNPPAASTKVKDAPVPADTSTHSDASAEQKKTEKEKVSAKKVNVSEPEINEEDEEEVAVVPKEPAEDPAVVAQREKEKMARMLEKAREQAAAARERKKSKKNKKFDKWIKEQEELKEARVKGWTEWITKEIDYTELIKQLLVTEFLRQTKNKAMGLNEERVLSDDHAAEVIASESRESYRVLFGEPNCRVVVAGLEAKDRNGRQGTLRYWDREREKFCVGLDTKKAPDSDVQFLGPENLDRVTSRSSKSSDKSTNAISYDISASEFLLYGGVALDFFFTIHKPYIIALGSAESLRIGLQVFVHLRDQEEEEKKREEEAERRREEEDRKRRAARARAQNAAW